MSRRFGTCRLVRMADGVAPGVALIFVLLTACGAKPPKPDPSLGGAGSTAAVGGGGFGSAGSGTGVAAASGSGASGMGAGGSSAGVGASGSGASGSGASGSGVAGDGASGTAGGQSGQGGVGGVGGPGDGGLPDGGDTHCHVGDQVYNDGDPVPSSDCNTCQCVQGAVQCTTQVCPTDGCVVARHLDRCCSTFVPALRSELAKDECLVAYPATHVDAALAERCAKKIMACTDAVCPAQGPSSRVAVAGEKGVCRFGDECQNNDDCTLVIDTAACCSCVQSVPVVILADDECLQPSGNTAAEQIRPPPPDPGSCADCSLPVACAACQNPPSTATCLIRDSFSICQ